MSLKLITLAALGAAAQASVADPGADQIVANAMEAVAIVASHTSRQLDSRFLATPAAAPAPTYILYEGKMHQRICFETFFCTYGSKIFHFCDHSNHWLLHQRRHGVRVF